MKSPLSLRNRVTLLAAAAVLPMVALAFVSAAGERRQESRNFRDNAVRLAETLSDVQERTIEQVRILLVGLARRPEVADRPGPACDRHVAELRRTFPRFANIGVVESDGTLSCSALPHGPVNSADHQYFQLAMRTRSFAIGSFEIGRQSGEPSVHFALPVLDSAGAPKRVVYAALSLASWAEAERDVDRQIPEGATLYRLDGEGHILGMAPSWDSARIGRVLPAFARIAADTAVSGVLRDPRADGSTLLEAFARVRGDFGNERVVVVLSVPEALAFAPVRQALRNQLAGLALVLLAVVGVTWLLGGGLIVRPLRAVADAAERLADGDLHVHLGPAYPSGEIGQVARAFDTMSASLRARETERDRAAAELRASEEELRELVAEARVGIVRLAPDGTFLAANPAMLRALGCASVDELRGLRMPDLAAGTGVTGAFAAAGVGADATVRWRRRDGRTAVLRTSGRAVRDAVGAVRYFEVFAEDVTEKHFLEERFRTLTENALAGIYIVEDGRLTYVNPALARIFGYEQQELIGADALAVIHPDDHALVRENMRRRTAGEVESLQYEFRGLRKDGSSNDILVLGASVDLGDKRIIIGNILDITERKRAEERFARLFRDSPLPSLLTRLSDGRALEVNDALLRMLGRRREEVVGRSTVELGVYEDPAARAELYDALRLRGRCVGLRARLRARDGAVRSALISATTLDLGGEACALSFAQDITDLEEARTLAFESEEKFARVFRSSLTAMSLSDLGDGRLIDVNDEYVRLLGFPREELIGRTSVEVGIFWRPADRERMVEALQGRSEVRDLEMRLRTRNGRAVSVLSNLQVIEEGGRPVLVAALLDLSAMQEAERALRASEQRFRAAFMTGTDTYVIVGRDDARMLEVNDRFEAMFGWPREEVLGRTSLELGVWADPTMRERMLAQLAAEGRVVNLEVLGRRRDGTTFPVLYSVSEMPASDPPALLGVIRDVSRERVLEEELRHSQKMEAIGRLTGGIAHDFNNLLNVVLANTALARSEITDPAAVGAYLADVETAAQQGSALVRKLLAFSRREQIAATRIDLTAALRDLERTLRRLLPETIAVRVEAPGGPLTVDADEGALEHIIFNLATNARDAMASGGTFTLSLGEAAFRPGRHDHAALGLDAPGRYAVVTATDTGTGMDQATLARAFDPFFTTKPRGAGTGLGLAMVFGLMKQQGGTIRIASTPGQGTAVHLYFPVVTGPAPEPAAKVGRAASGRGGTETLLVVEDQELMRRAAQRSLSRLGYTVLTAADGAEALRVLAGNGDAVALVVSDLVMPGIGGAELYERLRAEGRPVRFLLMSGHADSPDGGAVPAGVPFIEKPWKVEALAAKVRELLDGPPPDA